MLYQMSNKQLEKEDFCNPPACYRGAPFWSWNCRITKQMIDEQLSYFKEMGMGGVHIHVRVGLKNQYMGEEFLELVRYCNEKAKELGLLCWLYDEDRYASGYAGGEVTKTIKYRARYLRLTTEYKADMLDDYEEFKILQDENVKVQGCLLKCYDIVLENGYLTSAGIIAPKENAQGRKWFLYLELEKETPWNNNQTYVDTMNEEATKSFLCHTHEKYSAVLQEEFGKNIPAIFTDEPHFIGLRMPDYAEGLEDILLPFTEKMPECYEQSCELDFFEAIPYIIWNRLEEENSKERYYYFETCCRMFTEAYCKTIKDWCDEHGLLSTGHILGEETLAGQAGCVGDAMRCYTEFTLPGIDNLCDYREFSAVKQASSVAHQMKREGVLSECYGVTQWDFDFRGYKLAGDWQAALGITTRVPHLAWASMSGEAKRDYPAAIGWQSPWYKEFRYIENYFARVNYCLTRGEPDVRIAVIHPVESMWMLQGPADQMGMRRQQLEEDFQNITEWLLTGGLDFDYIAESVLETEESTASGKRFVCGAMHYDVVIVPNCISLRKNTVERLLAFHETGGSIIFYGQGEASLKHTREFHDVNAVVRAARCVSGKVNLLEALEPWRQIDIRGNDGNRRNIYLHRFRKEGQSKWLFLAQAFLGMKSRERTVWNRRALHAPEEIMIRIKGHWLVEKYDALNGEATVLESRIENKDTVISYHMYGDDSLLLHLKPMVEQEEMNPVSEALCDKGSIDKHNLQVCRVEEPVSYTLSEPNVLLLDKCFYSLDEEEEQNEAEILGMDNAICKQLGYPLRMESVEQPYVRNDEAREHLVRMRFVFESQIEAEGCKLALEERAYSRIWFNNESVDIRPTGYYVDKAIETVLLPTIQKGKNELVVEIQYGRAANLEWMYILGDFGVNLYGSKKIITSKPEKIFWGDYTRQGFPFYTGNMTYSVKIEVKDKQKLSLRIPYFSGAAIRVEGGRKEQLVAFLPNDCELASLPEGENIIRLTCLGNRFNGFGQLHMIGNDLTWVGPDSWRTEAESWTETYQLKEMGILSEPLLMEMSC